MPTQPNVEPSGATDQIGDPIELRNPRGGAAVSPKSFHAGTAPHREYAAPDTGDTMLDPHSNVAYPAATELLDQPARNSGTLGDMRSPGTEAATGLVAPPPRRRTASYRDRWRAVPRELGFLLPLLPIVVIGFSVAITLFSAGVGLIILWVGIFVLIAALLISRGFGELELVRLEAAGQPVITRPNWKSGSRTGIFGWMLNYLTNAHYWFYLLHTVVVNFAVGLFSWIVAFCWLVVGLGGVTHWFWAVFLPQGADNHGLVELIRMAVTQNVEPTQDRVGAAAAESIFNGVIGLALLATLPLITRALVTLHHTIAVGLLGAFPSEQLSREVADLAESRSAAVAAEDQALRRLERDIHDGPQQRLVRLQYDLASAERALESDPATARDLIGAALQQSRETLDELRDLSRGLVPPILQDRGLPAALDSAVGRSIVPITAQIEIENHRAIPSEVERSTYFVVAELLTNINKHSGASGATLDVSNPVLSGKGSLSRDLTVVVVDDGGGAAELKTGHGLAGVAERIAGLRGTFALSSPAGGPTTIRLTIPYRETQVGSAGSA
jgi:signal transduction histidine kinase